MTHAYSLQNTCVRIYIPPKTAMQSGKAKTKQWILEYSCSDDRFYDPIMGWTGSSFTPDEVSLSFDTLEEALVFSKELGVEPVLIDTPFPQSDSHVVKKSYAENFRYNKPPLN